MKTLGSVLSVVALACGSASFAVGCGCDPGNSSQRAPIDFTPSSSNAIRTPVTCGAATPAYGASDTFTLKLLGSTDVAPPYTLVTLDVAATAHVNDAVPLFVTGSSASSSDGAMQFTLANADQLDASPLASVVVTMTSLPAADGDPLSAELHLTFEDGRVLDQVYAAPVQTVCAH